MLHIEGGMVANMTAPLDSAVSALLKVELNVLSLRKVIG